MHRIIDGRGTGKTSRLMLAAKENNGRVICSNPDAMKYKADRYGITGIDISSYEDLVEGNIPNSKQPLYIDEIDKFLKAVAPNIDGYTLTNEE